MPRKPLWPPHILTSSDGKRSYIRLRTAEGPRDIPLGPPGSPEALREYARIILEVEAAGGVYRPADPQVTVAEVAAGFLAHPPADHATAKRHVRAMARLRDIYGHTPAKEFGPLALRAVMLSFTRDVFRGQPLSRRYINTLGQSVRQAFRWAAAEQLIPASVWESLAVVDGIRKGRSAAREKPEVRPADPGAVERTLPALWPVVRDMVRLQLATGCRPGEVCALRPCDLVRPWQTVDGVGLWLYRLDEHKNDWRGHLRWIPIGPQAQAIILPYLEREAEAYCFSARENMERRAEDRRAARRTRQTPSQARRDAERAENAEGLRRPRDWYDTQSYGHSIRAGCKRADVEPWAPNQLRHLVGTIVRTRYGLEDAQAVLGHDEIDTTTIYARQVDRAAKIIAVIG